MTGWKYLYLFFIVVDSLIMGIQVLLYLKAQNLAKESRNPRILKILINTLFVVFNVPLIIIFIFKIHLLRVPVLVLYGAVYPFFLWHFASFLLFLLYLAGKFLRLPFDSVLWVLKQFERPKAWLANVRANEKIMNYDLRRRMFVRRSITVLIGGAVVGSAYGAFRRDDYEISCVDLPIINLPERFENFTITMLTDIHSSIFMEREQMETYVKATNDLGGDMVVVTGDFVNSLTEEVYPFAEAFSGLHGRYGVYGVLGNHDFFTRNVEVVAKEVNDCGIRLLRDQTTAINKDGQKIYLMGVDDVGTAKRAGLLFDDVLRDTEPGIPKILLCHRPYFFEQAAERNIEVTLSGHTHGGQLVIARIGGEVLAPARMASPYVAGLYTRGASQMYVSRGIGTVGIPVRVNCPPEITKFKLVRA